MNASLKRRAFSAVYSATFAVVLRLGGVDRRLGRRPGERRHGVHDVAIVPVHVVEVGGEVPTLEPSSECRSRTEIFASSPRVLITTSRQRVARALERDLLREVRLDVLGRVEEPDLRLGAVRVRVVRVVRVQPDEGDGERRLLALGAWSNGLVGRARDPPSRAAPPRWTKLRDAERLARDRRRMCASRAARRCPAPGRRPCASCGAARSSPGVVMFAMTYRLLVVSVTSVEV